MSKFAAFLTQRQYSRRREVLGYALAVLLLAPASYLMHGSPTANTTAQPEKAAATCGVRNAGGEVVVRPKSHGGPRTGLDNKSCN